MGFQKESEMIFFLFTAAIKIRITRLYSLKFIRLLRVVFSSLNNDVTEGVITTRSNRMKFRLHRLEIGCGPYIPIKFLFLGIYGTFSFF